MSVWLKEYSLLQDLAVSGLRIAKVHQFIHQLIYDDKVISNTLLLQFFEVLGENLESHIVCLSLTMQSTWLCWSSSLFKSAVDRLTVKWQNICDPTWTILYKKEKTSETLAFFLDVATTDVTCVKYFNNNM